MRVSKGRRQVRSTVYVQQVAAEASAALVLPQRFCELLAMKMNDWEQIRLFLGDLHLVHHEKGKRATWLIERDVKKKKKPQQPWNKR